MSTKQKAYKYIDPTIQAKKNYVETNLKYYQKVPLFNIVEFNIFGACNRTCSFCPVSDTTFYENVYKGIDIDLYKKIIPWSGSI